MIFILFDPVFASMGAFLKSKSGQEAQFTGLQAAFDAYQLFDTLASGNFVDNMLAQLATVSIGIQKTTVEQHFTQLLLTKAYRMKAIHPVSRVVHPQGAALVTPALLRIKHRSQNKLQLKPINCI
ncbi:MAG: hypothetical protein ACKOAD_05750 [Gammaproteobacteria bacterium]